MKFINKHIKIIFLGLIIASMLLGLLYKNNKGSSHSQTEFLLDTQCTITVLGNDAENAVSAAFDEVKRIHTLTNFYDSSSQVSKINSSPANTEILVDKSVMDILTVSLEICEASDGAFDITIAPLSELWNFGGETASPPDEKEINKAKELVNFKNILLNSENNTVTKTNSKTMIDLGGAAKGYAADCAIKILKKYDIDGGIVDLGGNISCFGKNTLNRTGEWRIGIQVPFSPTGEYSEIITLKHGSVVTSGTYQRYFNYLGKTYHHILNPETGHPADEEYSSVTITSESSLLADCLSTACFVLGREKGTALAEKYNAEILFQ